MDVYRNREKRKLELVSRIRKCLFLYQYWMHREFGFLSARMQTWFPFSVQVCVNRREWLARQMDRVRRKYVRIIVFHEWKNGAGPKGCWMDSSGRTGRRRWSRWRER